LFGNHILSMIRQAFLRLCFAQSNRCVYIQQSRRLPYIE
jgi:hypothetical protein